MRGWQQQARTLRADDPRAGRCVTKALVEGSGPGLVKPRAGIEQQAEGDDDTIRDLRARLNIVTSLVSENWWIYKNPLHAHVQGM